MTKSNLPKAGQRYIIKLFYTTEEIPVVFYLTYIDLFGNTYNNFFMDDTGKIFEITYVQEWK